MDAPPSLLQSSLATASIVSNEVASATVSQATAANLPIVVHDSTSWLVMLENTLLAMVKLIPGLLVWIITFSTITLPTVLFALFSTSLTFTMNFTTLYVHTLESAVEDLIANMSQTGHTPRLRLFGFMDRSIPLPEYVCSITPRTTAQRAPDRSLPGYTRWRLKARPSELPRRISECYQGVWVS